jgi:predicted enzyme related to lactoylglutathione lyase
MDSPEDADLHLPRPMIPPFTSPVVHLELHTGNLAGACSFYSRVCGWRLTPVSVGGRSYQAFDWGGELVGGVVECGTSRAVWVPYLDVSRIDEATECARLFGASVLLEPREGAGGWRSVVRVPEGGEIAFWQSKTRTDGR